MNKVVLIASIAAGVGLAATAAWQFKYHLYGYLPATSSEVLTNQDGLMLGENGQPFTGRAKTITDSGYSVYSYQDGQLEGLNVVFSEGRLREIGHWLKGEQNGLFQSWTSEGILVDHAPFKDGAREGQTIQYYADSGKLKVKADYKAGKLHGMVEQYFPSGALQFKHLFVDHQLHGEALDYFENGHLKSSVVFDHGVQHGAYKIFADDGQILEVGSLDQGVRHGPFVFYFPKTGKIAMQGNFEHNQYHGEVTFYRPDGTKIVQNYEHGVAQGYQYTYSPQGALLGKIMMHQGKASREEYATYNAQGQSIEQDRALKSTTPPKE